MNNYYVEGKEITEIEMEQITRDNAKYLATDDFAELLKCKFIVKL